MSTEFNEFDYDSEEDEARFSFFCLCCGENSTDPSTCSRCGENFPPVDEYYKMMQHEHLIHVGETVAYEDRVPHTIPSTRHSVKKPASRGVLLFGKSNHVMSKMVKIVRDEQYVKNKLTTAISMVKKEKMRQRVKGIGKKHVCV